MGNPEHLQRTVVITDVGLKPSVLHPALVPPTFVLESSLGMGISELIGLPLQLKRDLIYLPYFLSCGPPIWGLLTECL